MEKRKDKIGGSAWLGGKRGQNSEAQLFSLRALDFSKMERKVKRKWEQKTRLFWIKMSSSNVQSVFWFLSFCHLIFVFFSSPLLLLLLFNSSSFFLNQKHRFFFFFSYVTSLFIIIIFFFWCVCSFFFIIFSSFVLGSCAHLLFLMKCPPIYNFLIKI